MDRDALDRHATRGVQNILIPISPVKFLLAISVAGHLIGETPTMTKAVKRVLQTFRKFRVTPGQMLCFYGPDLERNKAALKQLTEEEMLLKESFKGGYTLTESGFAAMKDCE